MTPGMGPVMSVQVTPLSVRRCRRNGKSGSPPSEDARAAHLEVGDGIVGGQAKERRPAGAVVARTSDVLPAGDDDVLADDDTTVEEQRDVRRRRGVVHRSRRWRGHRRAQRASEEGRDARATARGVRLLGQAGSRQYECGISPHLFRTDRRAETAVHGWTLSLPRRCRAATAGCRAVLRPARRCRRATARVTSKTSRCIARFVITARPSRLSSHVEAR